MKYKKAALVKLRPSIIFGLALISGLMFFGARSAEANIFPDGTRVYRLDVQGARCLFTNYWWGSFQPDALQGSQNAGLLFFSKAEVEAWVREQAQKDGSAIKPLQIQTSTCKGPYAKQYNDFGYDFESYDIGWKWGFWDWGGWSEHFNHFTVRGLTLGPKPNCKANEKLENGKCVSTGPTPAEVSATEKSKGSCSKPTCAGEPTNFAYGNQYELETDYDGPALSFVRRYNSQHPIISSLGFGWSSNYHRGIEKTGDFLVLRSGSGKGNVVQNINGVWTADADAKFILTQTSTGFVVNYQDGHSETYDADGHLLTETDKAGRTTHYSYANGQLASVTGPYGHTLTFAYNATGLLASMTDPAGQVTQYAYDSNDNLASVTHPDGTTRTYQYENTTFPHALTGITDENGNRYLTASYNSEGKSIMNELASGQYHFDFQYDSDTQTTTTDAAGTINTYQFAENLGIKNPVKITNQSDGKSTIRAYDANNNLTSLTDPEGRTTTYTYNAANQRTSMTEAAGTAAARTTTYEYLSSDLTLPTLVTRPSVAPGSDATTAIAYTSNLPTQITQSGYTPGGTPVSRAISLTYTPSGQVATIDGPRTDVNDVTTMTYYDCITGGACGQLKSVTNALGQTTTYDSYDTNGRVLQASSPNGLVTSYTYDVRGRVLSITQTSGSESHAVSYTYDGAGQLITATDTVGRVLTYGYNAARELIQVSDNLGNKVVYAYDSRGNRTTTQTIDPDGSMVRSIERTFDARNRAATVNAAGSITQRVFDATGNLVSETDPNNNPATTHAIDGLDRLLQSVDRLGGTTSYQYNIADRLTEVAAPNGAITHYVYDDLGNELSESSPDRGTTNMANDNAGNLVQLTDARGIAAAISYDALNRITKIDYPGDNDDVTYSYDNCDNGVGRLCEVRDASGTTDYTYTGFGNAAKQVWNTEGREFTTAYTYDAANRVATMTYPDGREVTYTRDLLGRVTQVSMTRDGKTDLLSSGRQYRADGLLTAQTLGNGITESRSYDQQGRLTDISSSGLNRSYQYDANGNVLGILDGNQNSTYQYDALDRLTSDQWVNDLVSRAIGFSYDANGNRTYMNASRGATQYDYVSNSNRLSRIGNHAYQLDAMGNTLSDGKRRFKYDATGRLSALYVHNQLRATYKYNSKGLRTRKSLYRQHDRFDRDEDSREHRNSYGMTLYHYDLNGELIAETTRQGEPVKIYVWANGQPIVQANSDDNFGEGLTKGKDKQLNWLHRWFRHAPKESLYYLQIDQLGTPRAATNSKGDLIWRWDGNAFGDTSMPSGILRQSESCCIESTMKTVRGTKPKTMIATTSPELFLTEHSFRCGSRASTTTPSPGCTITGTGTTIPKPDGILRVIRLG